MEFKKRAKVTDDKNCLLVDEIKYEIGQPVSEPDLASLVGSELFADVEPELSDLSSNAAQNAKTQEQQRWRAKRDHQT